MRGRNKHERPRTNEFIEGFEDRGDRFEFANIETDTICAHWFHNVQKFSLVELRLKSLKFCIRVFHLFHD